MHSSILALLISSVSAGIILDRQATPSPVCKQIAANIAGHVYYSPGTPDPLPPTANFFTPDTPPFTRATTYWMTSSSQTPQCVVEVSSEEDISTAIQIIGSTKTPFAVRSAGYTSNPGFSSTTGVHISLEKMKMVKVADDKQTVEVGLGNSFMEVYRALNGTGVTVVGARVDGPGTGGVTLACGYSWYTNQHGLGCDTVVSYQVVLPSGEIVTATNTSNPDLFFALKGGLNRFGIVSKIVFKAVPQPARIYGGLQMFSRDAVPALINATESFQLGSMDPKASVVLTLNGGTNPGAILLSFYDGPQRPADFDVFNNIPEYFSNLATQDYATMVARSLTSLQAGSRGTFASVSTSRLTRKFLDAVDNETNHWSQYTESRSGGLLQLEVEPFHDYGKYATDSAYPHADSPLPLNAYFSWTYEKDDAFWNQAIQQSITQMTAVAKAEGILIEGSVYPGYAYRSTTGEKLYGNGNAQKLRTIMRKYDPQEVMLLAGGFTI